MGAPPAEGVTLRGGGALAEQLFGFSLYLAWRAALPVPGKKAQ